jgi:hypothetical protein
MKATPANSNRNPLGALQQYVRKPRQVLERCELCALEVAPGHSHLLELDTRRVTCVCDACAILFDGNARQRYRRIPREVKRLRSFTMDDQEWDSLLIPINLAYFVHVTSAGKTIAQYPSPGGAMESSLDLEYWNSIVERNPVLKTFQPDVEALLVNRISQSRGLKSHEITSADENPADEDPADGKSLDGKLKEPQYYRAPIDQCFRLVGIIRRNWRGLSGGGEVWKAIDGFFRELAPQDDDHQEVPRA